MLIMRGRGLHGDDLVSASAKSPSAAKTLLTIWAREVSWAENGVSPTMDQTVDGGPYSRRRTPPALPIKGSHNGVGLLLHGPLTLLAAAFLMRDLNEGVTRGNRLREEDSNTLLFEKSRLDGCHAKERGRWDDDARSVESRRVRYFVMWRLAFSDLDHTQTYSEWSRMKWRQSAGGSR